MKKITLIAVALTMIISMTSCGNTDSSSSISNSTVDSSNKVSSSEQSKVATDAKVVVLGDLNRLNEKVRATIDRDFDKICTICGNGDEARNSVIAHLNREKSLSVVDGVTVEDFDSWIALNKDKYTTPQVLNTAKALDSLYMIDRVEIEAKFAEIYANSSTYYNAINNATEFIETTAKYKDTFGVTTLHFTNWMKEKGYESKSLTKFESDDKKAYIDNVFNTLAMENNDDATTKTKITELLANDAKLKEYAVTQEDFTAWFTEYGEKFKTYNNETIYKNWFEKLSTPFKEAFNKACDENKPGDKSIEQAANDFMEIVKANDDLKTINIKPSYYIQWNKINLTK